MDASWSKTGEQNRGAKPGSKTGEQNRGHSHEIWGGKTGDTATTVRHEICARQCFAWLPCFFLRTLGCKELRDE